jgi:hypothetical protein
MLDGAATGNAGFQVFVAGTSYVAMSDDAGNVTISNVPAKAAGYLVLITKGMYTDTWKGTTTYPVSDGAAAALGTKSVAGSALSDGSSGLEWKGNLAAAPASPQKNWVYYNTTDKKSYIYDGTAWQVLAQDGADGVDGAEGSGQGAKGDTGAQGPKGDQGDTGAQGAQGEQGPKGDTGAEGQPGEVSGTVTFTDRTLEE